MVRLVLFAFLFSCSHSFAQDRSFHGKWKVILVDNGVAYNYKTEETIVHKAFADSLKGQADSMDVIGMYQSFAASYENYYFMFEKNGKYSETREGEVRVTGTYKVDVKNRKIILVLKPVIGEPRNGYFEYAFKQKHLELKIPSVNQEVMKIVLEKY